MGIVWVYDLCYSSEVGDLKSLGRAFRGKATLGEAIEKVAFGRGEED